MGRNPPRVESHNAASLQRVPVLCSGLVRPPEAPPDSETGMYQSFLLVRYLVNRFGGEAFIGNLWRAAKLGENPWDTN